MELQNLLNRETLDLCVDQFQFKCYAEIDRLFEEEFEFDTSTHTLLQESTHNPSSTTYPDPVVAASFIAHPNPPKSRVSVQHTVAKMCSNAGIDGYRGDHSLRATNTTRLFSVGADERKRTGHRSIYGMKPYERTSDHLNMSVSDILNRQPCLKCPNISHTRSQLHPFFQE